MRTDGAHNRNQEVAVPLAQHFHCHDCGVDFFGTDLKIWHPQLGGGSPAQRLAALADAGLTIVDEDQLRCANCESRDISVVAGE
jgi:hypothetical protein